MTVHELSLTSHMSRRIRRAAATLLALTAVSLPLMSCQRSPVPSPTGSSGASSEGTASETNQTTAANTTEATTETAGSSDSGTVSTEPPAEGELPNIGGEDMPVIIEAEDGDIRGPRVHDSQDGYSGSGYVGEFRDNGDEVSVSFILDEAGPYKLSIGYYLPTASGHKVNTILVNGDFYAGYDFQPGDAFQVAEIGTIVLEEGRNSLTFKKGENDWGWMFVDYFSLDVPGDEDTFRYETTETLIDSQATPETVRLYQYLRSLYGQSTLAGQQLYFSDESEISRLLELTGKKPALKGYDFINQTPGGDIDDQVERAIRWVEEENGILTMCWHWWAPSGGRAFYTKDTSFDVTKAVTPGTEEYELIIRDIDIIAGQLLDMQERGIPVIWRPLHEASGGWFWWGAKGPEAYKVLWDILYDRLVNVHGVHNLIWVANAQSADWYVGDDKADIIGEDIYPGERVYSSYPAKFREAYDQVSGRKIVALTENGVLPDIEEMKATGAMWAWFMPWWGDFTTTDRYTEDDVFREVYAHENVITLDELPPGLYTDDAEDSGELKADWQADVNLSDAIIFAATAAPMNQNQGGETMDNMEFVRSMQPGWNLGNTLDATGGETSWGNPEVTQELLHTIREEGFRSIRIPVTYDIFVGPGPEFTIDPVYLARVREVVQMALDEGFIVMINMHHDSRWLHDLVKTPALLDRFRGIWVQIAEEFKDFPDELIFEAINEPRFSDDWGAETDGFLDAVDSLNNAAYEIIRGSGGNNSERRIVFETLTAGISPKRIARLKASIQEKNDPRLIASVHYYGMWFFSMNMAGKTNFDEEVQEEIDRQFQLLHDNLVADNIPVILGEYGLLGFDTHYDVIQRGETLKFFDYLVSKNSDLGITTMVWDNGQHMDRKALKWRDPKLAATIMAAVDGRSGQAEHDTVYLAEGSITEAYMPLILNGNILTAVKHGDETLAEGTDYELDGETLILKQEMLERLTGGRKGRDTKLDLEFSHGPAWELTVAVIGDVVLEAREASSVEFRIPAEFNGDRVRRVKAVDGRGKSIAAQNWQPYLANASEYEANYEENFVRLDAATLQAMGEGELHVTLEMWSGAEYPYAITIGDGIKAGAPGTEAPALPTEQTTETAEESTEGTSASEPSQSEGTETAEPTETPEEAAELDRNARRAGIGLAAAAGATVAAAAILKILEKRRRDKGGKN